jgi:hypothetical protein
MAAPSRTSTARPADAATERARSAKAAGVRAPAGSFTRSRASHAASTTRAARSRAGSSPAGSPATTTSSSEAVGGQAGALGQGPGGGRPVEPVGDGVEHGGRHPGRLPGPAHDGGAGGAEGAGVEVGGVAEADGQHRPPAVDGQPGLARVALEPQGGAGRGGALDHRHGQHVGPVGRLGGGGEADAAHEALPASAPRAGRKADACQRAIVHSRSESRLR